MQTTKNRNNQTAQKKNIYPGTYIPLINKEISDIQFKKNIFKNYFAPRSKKNNPNIIINQRTKKVNKQFLSSLY